jgi:2'-5' RNA ligase
VSEKKADKQRFWITYLLKDLNEGANFSPDILHLTIIPWFVTDKSTEEVINLFREQFSGRKSLKVSVNEPIEFRSRRKIPVNPVSRSNELFALHKEALHFFDLLRARWAVKTPYVDEDYIPHVRRRFGHNVSAGDILDVSSLELVGARRRGDDERTVIAKVKFDA